MTDFATWDRETLNRFAQESSQELLALKEELRVAIDAYRKLVIEQDRIKRCCLGWKCHRTGKEYPPKQGCSVRNLYEK
jgi:hypothetical protein